MCLAWRVLLPSASARELCILLHQGDVPILSLQPGRMQNEIILLCDQCNRQRYQPRTCDCDLSRRTCRAGAPPVTSSAPQSRPATASGRVQQQLARNQQRRRERLQVSWTACTAILLSATCWALKTRTQRHPSHQQHEAVARFSCRATRLCSWRLRFVTATASLRWVRVDICWVSSRSNASLAVCCSCSSQQSISVCNLLQVMPQPPLLGATTSNASSVLLDRTLSRSNSEALGTQVR